MSSKTEPPSSARPDVKRCLDLLLAAAALTLLAPLLLLAALLLKLTGEHQIFFLQNRVGQNGRIFSVIKFITMRKGSNQLDGAVNKSRILPLGRVLRITKIDELPQLFNVLRGDMSIIGPRPLTVESFQYYSPEARQIIARMRPGLSGIGSIVFRHEAQAIGRSKANFMKCYARFMPYKGELEKWYFLHQNLLLDVKLLLLTVLVTAGVPVNVGWWLNDMPPMPRSVRLMLSRRPPAWLNMPRLVLNRAATFRHSAE